MKKDALERAQFKKLQNVKIAFTLLQKECRQLYDIFGRSAQKLKDLSLTKQTCGNCFVFKNRMEETFSLEISPYGHSKPFL